MCIGTAHVWSVFEELEGDYTSLDEKILYLSQCFNEMYKHKHSVIFIGDTNLMGDGETMQALEKAALNTLGISDVGAKKAVATWDGIVNKTQIRHRERHRPDRLLVKGITGNVSVDIVHVNERSDHYAISATVAC